MPAKNHRFLRFIQNNYHNQLLQTGFFRITEAIATSLIPLDIILPEICAFILGFSCTVWAKMRSLACSLVDGMLGDAIIIYPHPTLPPTNIRKGKGCRKKYKTSNRKTIY